MYLGIEIGGTKLQLGFGTGDGLLAAHTRDAVDVNAGADGIRQQILAAVPELLRQAGLDRAAIRGVGIGFGGPVDDATRTVIKSHQIEGWDGFPLAEWITDLLGWPVSLGNDADVAGLAEALFGAGKGLSPIFYITLGSGIGGGFITDGEVYRGCGRGAAEIGHLRVMKSGICRDGYVIGATDVTLERRSSGWGIARTAEDYVELPGARTSLLHRMRDREGQRLSARDVAVAAAAGDGLARDILEGAWTSLALGICHVIALLCPRRIIIGGGVSLMGEQLLFEPLRRFVLERVFKPFAGCYDIVPAALGEEVVVHGALALARKRFGELKP
jgi:glucokinase